jgi:alkaline phosphatase D
MEADTLLGRLMAGLDTIPLPVDVILTSDHGMMKMSPEPATYIFMDDLVDMKDSTLVLMNTGTHLHIYTNDPARQATLAQDLQARQAHFSVYTHATMPAAWHYTHERVGDVLVAAEPGYYITTHREYDARRLRDPNPTVWGTHGYDPAATTDMNGIFYARGPHVKTGVTLPPMENVHVFPVVTRILGIPNPEIDGSAKKTKKMYRK